MSNETAHTVIIAAMALSGCPVRCDIPEGTCWIAQDADGEWFAYPRKPVLHNNVWNMPIRPEEAYGLGMGDKSKDATLMIFTYEQEL